MRSTDGENFKVIGWVNGNGNQTTITEYTYEDYSIEKGITYYYQLKQIDYDGQYEYFNIEPLTLTDINLQKPISVKRVNILGQEDVNGNMIIEIYDNRIVKKMIIK